MKYCLNYTRNSHMVDAADEVIVRMEKNNITNVIDYIRDHEGQRVILRFKEMSTFRDNTPLVISLNKYNIAVMLDVYNLVECEDIISICKENGIKFFFSEGVYSADKFNGLIELGVSDIYVIEELGFCLAKIAEKAKENNVQIRCYPNVAQSAWNDTPAIKKFFIRPEDVDVYAEYVDVLEFWGEGNLDPVYETYSKDKKWFGKLNEIILNFNSEIDNRCIVDMFGSIRTKCDKRCMKGGVCATCPRCEELAETMAERGYGFTHIIEMVDKEE